MGISLKLDMSFDEIGWPMRFSAASSKAPTPLKTSYPFTRTSSSRPFFPGIEAAAVGRQAQVDAVMLGQIRRPGFLPVRE